MRRIASIAEALFVTQFFMQSIWHLCCRFATSVLLQRRASPNQAIDATKLIPEKQRD
jgi:hypothetical protein